MRLPLVLLLLLAVEAGASPLPRDYDSRTCAGEWLCVYTRIDDDGTVRFRARNLSEHPITVALRVTPRNLHSDTGNRHTVTLAGDSDEALLDFTRVNRSRRTHYRYRFKWVFGPRNPVHDDDYLYRLPYADNKRYRVLQGYGSQFSHTGTERFAIDFQMAIGTPVHAARDGVVVKVVESFGEGCWAPRCADRANHIVVLHEDGTTGEYYHLDKNGALVEEGAHVRRGQHIARSGNSGHSTMPHLHFAVYRFAQNDGAQSIPVRFVTADGAVAKPRRGPGYLAK